MKHTIETSVKYEQKIQRSRFSCFVFPVRSMEEIREVISSHHKEYSDATHNCYAYILGEKQEIQYYSDAGEPSGTAGKPMLNALLSKELTNVLAIVTRYYGGIKLGVKGLIDAYRSSVLETITQAKIIVYEETTKLNLVCEYQILELIKQLCTEHRAKITIQSYTNQVQFSLEVPVAELEEMKNYLAAFAAQNLLEFR